MAEFEQCKEWFHKYSEKIPEEVFQKGMPLQMFSLQEVEMDACNKMEKSCFEAK